MKSQTLLLLLFFWSVGCIEQPVVNTKLGRIQGVFLKTISNRKISGFRGIPFARPPVGELRFKPPSPALQWPGVLNASLPSSICLQYDHFLYKTKFAILGSEDCLYLNVFTPKISNFEENLLDVIVFIHGGAFMFHTGNYLGPDYLLDRNVVFVTINYRLGPLGFMSTGDEEVPGNNGLKDQNLALHWVQENIKSFGGNPRKVTLAGMSAGGASVHYHMLSPRSQGLFHKAIALSGTALCPWAQAENVKEKTQKIAATLGCPIDKEMVHCLRTRPANQIVQLSALFIPWLYSPFSPFGPIVEPENPTSFISEQPIDIIKSKKASDVPFLVSFTSDEGLYPGSGILKFELFKSLPLEILGNENYAKELTENWDSLLPHLLDFNYTIEPERKSSISQKIKLKYLPDGDVLKNKHGFIQMLGERLFSLPIAQTALRHAENNKFPVHVYQFSYEGKYRLVDHFMSPEIFGGACHGDDLPYIVKMNVPVEKDDNLKKLSGRMIDIWMDFINGKMDQKWTSVQKSLPELSFLNIEGYNTQKDVLIKKMEFSEERFWSSLGFKENVGISLVNREEL